MTRTLPIGKQAQRTSKLTILPCFSKLARRGRQKTIETSVICTDAWPPLEKRGFTIMELLLVLTIIAILSSVSMPVLKGFAATRRLKASAYTVRDLLAFARDMAITGRNAHLVVFDLDRGQYWLASSETFDPRNPLTSAITASNSTAIAAQPRAQSRDALEGTQRGLSRTGGIMGIPHVFEQNVRLVAMVTNHSGRTAQVDSGVEYVYFSPTSTSEHTLMYLQNQRNQVMSITVEAASGHIRVQQLTQQDIEMLGFETEL